MHSLVISKWFFIFLTLLVFASCGREGGKMEADKAKAVKSATKTAATGTVRVDSAPKRTSSNKATSKKTDFSFNGVTQFQ